MLCGEFMPRDNVKCIHPDYINPSSRSQCSTCELIHKNKKEPSFNLNEFKTKELIETLEELIEANGNLSQKETSEYILNYIRVLHKSNMKGKE